MLELDARRRRGTYLVITESGTRYWLWVDKRPSGFMKVISNGKVGLREGVVGGESCCPEPVVRVGDHMHLVAAGKHIVRTSVVVSITPTDVCLESLACKECKAYRPPNAERCPVCRY